jgi:hypothetical protein
LGDDLGVMTLRRLSSITSIASSGCGATITGQRRLMIPCLSPPQFLSGYCQGIVHDR